MLVYVTRPNNHEVIMGGWRGVPVWTDIPHYYHWPEKGWAPMPGEDQTAVYYDRGWRARGYNRSGCRFKPLAAQNSVLEGNAWQLLLWSCLPKTAEVQLQDTFEWCDTLLPDESENDPFCRTNIDTLLYHVGGATDLAANVHYKRFLMEVNLITGECKLLVPRVHFYDGNKTVETMEIEEPYASRTNYAVPEMDDIPF